MFRQPDIIGSDKNTKFFSRNLTLANAYLLICSELLNNWKEHFVGVLICALDVFCDNIVFQQEMNKICAWNNNEPFRQNIEGGKSYLISKFIVRTAKREVIHRLKIRVSPYPHCKNLN